MEDKLCNLVLNCAQDKKAKDIVIIDISDVSILADYMFICSGTSNRHVQGIANFILEEFKLNNETIFNVDGMDNCEWVLLDLGNIIVHIMQEDTKFYTLEKLWNNGKVIYEEKSE